MSFDNPYWTGKWVAAGAMAEGLTLDAIFLNQEEERCEVTGERGIGKCGHMVCTGEVIGKEKGQMFGAKGCAVRVLQVPCISSVFTWPEEEKVGEPHEVSGSMSHGVLVAHSS